MEFIYYIDKEDLQLYGYESDRIAQEFHDNYDNLTLLDEKTSNEYRFNKPKGGRWTHEGWVIDPELLAEAEAQEELAKKAELTDRYNTLKQEMVFEGLMGRDTSELKGAILLIETELKEIGDE